MVPNSYQGIKPLRVVCRTLCRESVVPQCAMDKAISGHIAGLKVLWPWPGWPRRGRRRAWPLQTTTDIRRDARRILSKLLLQSS